MHFALRNKNIEIIKILFYYGARPWSNQYFKIKDLS
jgi:hypothetical protein